MPSRHQDSQQGQNQQQQQFQANDHDDTLWHSDDVFLRSLVFLEESRGVNPQQGKHDEDGYLDVGNTRMMVRNLCSLGNGCFPDARKIANFAFPKQKLAIFVDGCFWHGCPNCYREPRKNTAFWKNKVVVNQRRDRRVSRQLREKGWKASSLPASCRNQLRSPDQRPEREDTSFCVFP